MLLSLSENAEKLRNPHLIQNQSISFEHPLNLLINLQILDECIAQNPATIKYTQS